jgi:DNA-binding NarL/FixJ family response regulator
MIKVLVAGDDVLARGGVRAALNDQPGIRAVGDCQPGIAVGDVVKALQPHVLLLHRVSEEAFGVTVKAARDARYTIRVLTIGSHEHSLRPNVEQGVCGVLPPSATAEQLVAAVRLASAGYVLFGGGEGPVQREAPVRRDGLSGRECEVLSLIAQGMSNAEIALALTVSEHTVKSHVQNLLGKLNLRNRIHAVIYAFETGLASAA